MKSFIPAFKFPLLLALIAAAPLAMAAEPQGPKGFTAEAAASVTRLSSEVQAQRLGFTVGLNPAMQYSLQQLCGTRPELQQEDFRAHAEGGYLNFEMTDAVGTTVLPKAYVGWSSSVKDQGQCGSCWDFSTIATLEAAALKKHGYPQAKVNPDGSITTSGDITILSEQQVLSCNPFGFSCDGGYFAFDMLMPKNAGQSGYYKGAVPAEAFPYVAYQTACSIPTQNSFTPVSQWGYVGSGNGIPSVYAIKCAIYKWGNVSACVNADNYFQAYTGGVFNDPSANTGSINHAIALVGWDDAKGACLLKNSWGPNWGVNGFMWIKYGTALVGTSPAWCLD